jgi:hypothetical protein
MTLQELKPILEIIGISIYNTVAKGSKREPLNVPYAVYQKLYNRILLADNGIYKTFQSVQLSVFHKQDSTLITKTDEVLKNANIIFEQRDYYDQDQDITQSIYEFEI